MTKTKDNLDKQHKFL